MPLPRYKQVNVDVTPYYHCTTRCVRQSYLCGCDNETGRNFEHRRKWIEDRLHLLSSSFSIELCENLSLCSIEQYRIADNVFLLFSYISNL